MQNIYPHLNRGVRLHWDAVRQQHNLLFPEGALTLNTTALAVLERCNGQLTVAEIARELVSIYQGATVEQDVQRLIAQLIERRLLVATNLKGQSAIGKKRDYSPSVPPSNQKNSTSKPLSLVAELTYRCPLRCPYCSNPLNYGDSKYQNELETSDWLRVIQQARELGVLQLGFSGGEPLLRQDLEILVEAAAVSGLYTTLVTAGTLFTKERADRLRDVGLDHVQISIQDSQAQESDRIAGVRSFEQKLAAARLAKDLGFPLTLNFVLHRQNIDRIASILDLCESLQADRVELANTQYYGWALHNRDVLLPTPEQLEIANEVVANYRKRSEMKILYVLPDYYQDYPKSCMGGWGQRTLVITPNGDGLPCQVAASIPGLEFANVRDRELDWIWFESNAFNRFRGEDWMSETCRSCSLREIDFGGCRCQAFLLTGDATATDPVCNLSPDRHLIVAFREKLNSVSSAPLIYRSINGVTTL